MRVEQRGCATRSVTLRLVPPDNGTVLQKEAISMEWIEVILKLIELIIAVEKALTFS
jgi:hypothetical protein